MGGVAAAVRLARKIAATARVKGLDGALFAVDNDDDPEHTPAHDALPDLACRFCVLHREAHPTALQRPTLGNRPLRFFFAVPVRTIETWLLLLKGHPFPGRPEDFGRGPSGRRQLKRLVYGAENADQRTRASVSNRLILEGDLADLERRSPSFRTFAMQVRGQS